MYNQIFKILGILYLFLLFFEAFVFLIEGHPFFWSYLNLGLLYLMVAISPKKFILHVIYLHKYTPLKYLNYFISFIMGCSIYLVVSNCAQLLIFYYIVVKFLLPTIVPLLMITYLVPKYIRIKQVIQSFLLLTLFIYIIGLIGFLGDLFNIKFLSTITNSLSNLKEATQGVTMMVDDITGLPRLRGIFHEPGSLGKYIAIFLPVIYNLCLSEYKIFKNKLLNTIVKRGTIPLTWLCLILTMSPVGFILASIISIIYFWKKFLRMLSNKNTLLLLICVLLLFLTSTTFLEYTTLINNSFLARIINVLSSGSLSELILAESSLASRISSFINAFILFLHKPFIGYGFDNVRFYMYNQFLNSPVPLTQENIINMKEAILLKSGVAFNKSLLFGILAETGIIGTFLYYLYLLKNLTFIKNMKKCSLGNLNYCFLDGLRKSCIIIIFSSFYLYTFTTTYVYYIYAIVISYVIYVNKFVILKAKMNRDSQG